MRLAGLVLAGGRGSRMGGETPKPLLDLGGRPLITHVLDRMPEEASPILVSANDDRFDFLGLPVVPDRIAGFAGPLAGLDAAAAILAARHPGVTHLICLPGDTPFLPSDLAEKLTVGLAANGGGRTAVALSRGALQPAAAVWTLSALSALSGFLASGAKASIRGFLDHAGYDTVEIGDVPAQDAPGGDPFFNLNTPAEHEAARLFLSRKP